MDGKRDAYDSSEPGDGIAAYDWIPPFFSFMRSRPIALTDDTLAATVHRSTSFQTSS
jgi:hypothetical protein